MEPSKRLDPTSSTPPLTERVDEEQNSSPLGSLRASTSTKATPSSVSLIAFFLQKVCGFRATIASGAKAFGRWIRILGDEENRVDSATSGVLTRSSLAPEIQDPDLQTTPPPRREEVLPYPGALTTEQKKAIQIPVDTETKLQLSFTHAPNISVSVRRQDLFQSGASVIVNAANTHLGGGDGIDGQIHKRGGTEYVNAHFALKRLYGGSESQGARYTRGYAAMLPSGRLKETSQIDQIIVIAGPAGEPIDDEKRNQLYSCYMNALLLADQEGQQSLAFPSISTGIFGFDKEEAAAIALRALYDFTKSHPETSLTRISIHFTLKNPHEFLDHYKNAAQ